MYNTQKDKTPRVSKERDYYRSELESLKSLVAIEQEAVSKE